MKDKIIEAIATTPSDGGGSDTLADILSPCEIALAADRVIESLHAELDRGAKCR